MGREQVLEGINSDVLARIGRTIGETIDFDQSQSNGQLVIKFGVDPQLDRVKRQSDGMDNLMIEVAKDLVRTLPRSTAKFLKSCTFFPHLGFLIALELDGHWNADLVDLAYDQGSWECVFTADGITYYKDDHMRALDERFGDTYCEIRGKLSIPYLLACHNKLQIGRWKSSIDLQFIRFSSKTSLLLHRTRAESLMPYFHLH